MHKTTKSENFVRIIICLFAFFLIGILTFASLFSTTGMEIIGDGKAISNQVIQIPYGNESVWYYHDNILANLLWLGAGTAICFAVILRLKKMSLKLEILILSVWVILSGSIWVISSQVAPTFDSWQVADAAVQAANDNLGFMEYAYFSYYPFQLGYVLLNEMLTRIYQLFAEVKNLLFLEIMNVLFLAGIYDGILVLNKKIFQDERIHQLTFLLFLFSIQPVISCSFIYGIYPGLLCAVWAIVFEAEYLRTEKIRFVLLSSILIALAYLIKPNYLICLIAMMIVAAVKLISSLKQPKIAAVCGAYILMSCCLSFSLPGTVVRFYESRSGICLKNSLPMISYISMGLSESDSAPGWYNENHTLGNFHNHDCNTEAAAEASREHIKDRLKTFSENTHYRDEFFYKKFVSQWNETSYQSIWNNKVREQYQEKKNPAKWICTDGEKSAKGYMDIYAQFIFTGVLLGCVACFRKKKLMQIIFPLIVIGGMMYHLLSESKSQYAIPYYILMTGFAAVGICWLYDKVMPYLKTKLEKRKEEKWKRTI